MTYLLNIKSAGWPKADNEVYIGRLQGTSEHYGNPFSHLDVKGCVLVPDRCSAVTEYMMWIREKRYPELEPTRRAWILAQLKAGALLDKVLFCWCCPQACHGAPLMKLQLDIACVQGVCDMSPEEISLYICNTAS